MLLGINLLAQVGTLAGVVYDSEGGYALPGASVELINLAGRGEVSDFDGKFVISNLPVGQHEVEVSYISFETYNTTIEIIEGQTTQLEVNLTTQSVQGAEVVITGQLLGQAKAINQQLKAESIANIVSADRIQELPDVNAAEAISRLPGVSINRSGGEGQKIVVRGLEPKFAAITVNGMRLPSNSATDRSVDLSLISPEMLDGIEVYKAPLPDMDAEAVAGTVNLRLRKAPKELNVLAKGLWGGNPLNDDYRDNKSVLQVSRRVLNNKLGVVAQASYERFNRGGDFLTNDWRLGAADSTGLRPIFGERLRLQNQSEIRRRLNSSLGLDFQIGNSNFSILGLYSQTDRDRFNLQETYDPNEPSIAFIGRDIENAIKLRSVSLQAEHPLKYFTVDWGVSNSRSTGETPYDFQMRFVNNNQTFDPNLNANSPPSAYYDAANIDLATTFLWNANFQESNTIESTNSAALNLKAPWSLGEKLSGYLKVGGKYTSITRNRDISRRSEDFYYLGGQIARDAISASSQTLTTLPENNELISVLTFADDQQIDFINEAGDNVGIQTNIDADAIRQWYDDQAELLNNDRTILLDRYEVEETVSAGYAMLKIVVGGRLNIIPGFRYEYSDNEYRSGLSTINGFYGVNGIFRDSTTTQQYGEFLPHLHIKYQITDWLDLRTSYTNTLARPDFNFVTPRIQIDDNQNRITAGNPTLRHARSQNFDAFLSLYTGKLGLISVGAFYKEITDLFYPWTTNLFNQETADQFGYSDFPGFELRTFINASPSTLRGFEVDIQTGFKFLPAPFNRLILNLNYARLESETEVFFLTSESRLINQIPPIFETTFTNNVRKVNMPSQSPNVFNVSLGYDYGKISARVSGAYQGTKVSNFSINQEFDTFDLEFWRWDASLRYKIDTKWSAFFNLNNFNNQQDISFVRNPSFVRTIQNYGATFTTGLQFRIR